MIRVSELAAATQLAPSVAPFTLRRLLLRARLFATEEISGDDLRRAFPVLEAGLQEMLTPAEHGRAMQALKGLLEREGVARGADAASA